MLPNLIKAAEVMDKLNTMSQWEIRDLLVQNNIKGLKRTGHACAIAKYIKAESGATIVEVGRKRMVASDYWVECTATPMVFDFSITATIDSISEGYSTRTVSRTDGRETSESVRNFILDFDEGKYPELEQ